MNTVSGAKSSQHTVVKARTKSESLKEAFGHQGMNKVSIRHVDAKAWDSLWMSRHGARNNMWMSRYETREGYGCQGMGLWYNVVVKAWGLGQHGTTVAFGCQGIGLGQLVNVKACD